MLNAVADALSKHRIIDIASNGDFDFEALFGIARRTRLRGAYTRQTASCATDQTRNIYVANPHRGPRTFSTFSTFSRGDHRNMRHSSWTHGDDKEEQTDYDSRNACPNHPHRQWWSAN